MTIDDAALIDYALGTVSRERTKEVESFLRSHPDAALRVRRMQDALAELVLTLPPEASSVDAEDDLVERLRRTSQPPVPHDRLRRRATRRSPRWAAFGIAVALGLAAWLILGPILRPDRTDQVLERYQSQPGALSSRLITQDGRELGTLVRLPDDRLFVAFEELPEGGVYQLWALSEGEQLASASSADERITPEASADTGTATEASADAQGSSATSIGERATSIAVVEERSSLSEPVSGADSLAITIEPAGGSERPTSEPLVIEPL